MKHWSKKITLVTMRNLEQTLPEQADVLPIELRNQVEREVFQILGFHGAPPEKVVTWINTYNDALRACVDENEDIKELARTGDIAGAARQAITLLRSDFGDALYIKNPSE